MHFKVITKRSPKQFETDLVEPVEAGKRGHGGVASTEGKEDLPRCISPDLEGGQLGPVREDVVLDTLCSQLHI